MAYVETPKRGKAQTPRAASSLRRAKNQMRKRIERGMHCPSDLGLLLDARVAQIVEVVLLYALGYSFDLGEEVEAFTAIIGRER